MADQVNLYIGKNTTFGQLQSWL